MLYNFLFHPDRRKQFINGHLVKQWRNQYPDLFDEDDVRLTVSQPTAHFYEWLAAILVYEATGFLNLVEYYISNTHPRKKALFREIVGEEIFRYVDTHQDGVPDLFLYAPDKKEWFFAEVKGNKDRIRNTQPERFAELLSLTGKEVDIITLTPLILPKGNYDLS